MTLGNHDLEAWRKGLNDPAIVAGIDFLGEMDINGLRDSCNHGDLEAIESQLTPIVAAAKLDSESAPPEVDKLMADKKQLDVARSVIEAIALGAEIERVEALIELTKSLEKEVRNGIRQRSQIAIDNISQDIGMMWSILHPEEKIESVRLELPPDADKAVDVVLKFQWAGSRFTPANAFRRFQEQSWSLHILGHGQTRS